VSGRQLTGSSAASPTCCRWTQGVTCPTSQSKKRDYRCTSVHEYLEHKTTTHIFEDIDSCLGSDDSTWGWRYDNTNAASVVLESSGAAVATVPTPLKVTHASGCASRPTLELQLNTGVAGNLTIGGDLVVNGLTAVQSLAIGGVDLLARLDAIEGRTTRRQLECRGTTSGVANKCAGYDGSSLNWQMRECQTDHHEIQLQWYGAMIMTAKTSYANAVERCMRLRTSDNNIVAEFCQGADSGDDLFWYFDGEQLHNRGTGTAKCVQCGLTDDDGNADVRLLDCDPTVSHQRWYWSSPGK